MDLMGLGRENLRKIPVDADHRVSLPALREAIARDVAAGHRPFCVVGNGGTVETGAVDPLTELAEIAREVGAWFHVDGSYGAFAAALPEERARFRGLERADSVSLDPHKWMNTPLEAGCVLVRDWRQMEATFSVDPVFLRGLKRPGEHNSWQGTFELTRSDRAMKIWIALRQFGADAFTRMFAAHAELARRLAAKVEADPDFELMSPARLGICCFRYRGRERDPERLNAINRALEEALVADGRALVSSTEINGARVLRACISNHHVTWADVEAVVEILRELGQRVSARAA
jgi:glutamate/tyrosine decarboxylase-like PLP-dependent enzyme